MGFDIFLSRFHNGEIASYAPRIAEEIFDRGALAPSDLSCVAYVDGRAEIYCDREEGAFDGFMLSHFSGNTVCERLLEIATVTKSMIHWPGEYIFLAVTDKVVIDHIPAELKDGSVRVALVQTVDELWKAIDAVEGDSEGIRLLLP